MSNGRQAGGKRWVDHDGCRVHITTERTQCPHCKIAALETKLAEKDAELNKLKRAAKQIAAARDEAMDWFINAEKEHDAALARVNELKDALRIIARGIMPEDYGKYDVCVKRLSDVAASAFGQTGEG